MSATLSAPPSERVLPGRATPRVSVVVPTRNESRNLPYVFQTLPDDVFEIIVVDGHSTDGTADVALGLDSRVRVVEQEGRGKGDALRLGFASVTGDIVVMLDADCSADGREIPRFVDTLRAGADFAKGTRYALGGGSEDITRLRSLGNKALTAQVNLLYRTRYSDLCYGYNAFWRHCLPHIAVDCTGFEVETLMMCRIAKAELTVAEVGSFEWNRRFGVSNLNALTDGLRVQRTILAELFRSPTAVEEAEAAAVIAERRRSVRGQMLDVGVERRACFRHLTA